MCLWIRVGCVDWICSWVVYCFVVGVGLWCRSGIGCEYCCLFDDWLIGVDRWWWLVYGIGGGGCWCWDGEVGGRSFLLCCYRLLLVMGWFVVCWLVVVVVLGVGLVCCWWVVWFVRVVVWLCVWVVVCFWLYWLFCVWCVGMCWLFVLVCVVCWFGVGRWLVLSIGVVLVWLLWLRVLCRLIVVGNLVFLLLFYEVEC